MISEGSESRRIIPRWRRTDDSRKPSGIRTEEYQDVSTALARLEEEWKPGPHARGVALELVSLAASSPRFSEPARQAAQWLLREGSLSPLARDLTSGYLFRQRFDDSLPTDSVEQIRLSLRLLRQRINSDPRNVIALTESARLHTMLGQTSQAEKLLERSLALNPNDRFLLRSATRFWVHVGKPDQAHDLLLSRERTKVDPWLMAAEISTAGLADKRTPNLRAARHLLGSGRWAARDLTELAGSLGTVLLDGKQKDARRLFRQSISDPNDNSLAQAEWAARRLPSGFADELDEVTEDSRVDEASALKAETDGDHHGAWRGAWGWLRDQPFSTKAAVFGSFHTAIVKNFDESFRFVDVGLRANPHSPRLLNNAAFALAKLDRVDEARKYFDRIQQNEVEADSVAVVAATRGLIAFRSGDPLGGVKGYREALELATTPTQRIIALLMFASEISRTSNPQAAEVVESAERGAENLPADQKLWLEHLPKRPG